ncbi:CheR family methyltransferase [Flavobacterium sp. 270]|uniref:CheR family methyltransferase n=1 Tax=Flavobacterium sp. 270 TaxID=2512114 RepID=UPI0014170711|nr:CheR family methyltransferase [Flavobacterium sp. 270]
MSDKIFDIRKQSFPIVGIATTLESFEEVKVFVKNLPIESNMSFILYLEDQKESETELFKQISDNTNLKVSTIEPGNFLEPDKLYILKSDQTLSHSSGTLSISNRRHGVDSLSAIDHFFVSLALACKEFSRAILLSENSTDGLMGLNYIKEQGGTAFARMPETIQENGRQYQDSLSEAADFVLKTRDIPSQLQLLEAVYDSNYSLSTEKDKHILEGDDETYISILNLLRLTTGNDFSNYKEPTIRRRIARRMVIAKINTSKLYLGFLKDNPVEVDLLFNDLLIPVTDFFRDSQVFKMLPEIVFPKIIENKKNNDRIRIWVAGCSTGEEAYSIAIALHEFLASKKIAIKVQIFASDISERAISKARAGIYSRQDVRRISENRLSRYFTKIESSYHINKEIRDFCIFASHNFIKDPPFAKLDLVSCRNALIYLDSYLQKKAFKTFHYGLLPTGMLLLGKSESTSYTPGLFEPLVKNLKIFSRQNSVHAKIPISRESLDTVAVAKAKTAKKELSQPHFQEAAQNILYNNYTPAGVIVNEKKEIIHFHGDTGAFLLSPQGKPNFNILEMVREGLAFEVRSALLDARKTGQKAVKTAIPVKDRKYMADIEVVPLSESFEEKHYLILFRKSVKIVGELLDADGVQGSAEKRIKTLEKEIEQLREDIKKVTEDQELANEELQSTNEELLSTSEELQTLNEELETSAEQLQSNNEELIAMNEELVDRQEQLVLSRLYAEAITENIREPLLIINNEMRVKSANASFYSQFSVSEDAIESRIIFDTILASGNLVDLRPQIEHSISKGIKLDNAEVKIIMGNGHEKTMIMNVRPISNNKLGEPLALLAFEDITDLLRTNKMLASTNNNLEDKNKQLASFTAVASHDLQEPLRKISLFSGMITNNPDNVLSEESTLHLNRILVSAGRMQHLIDDLLMYSKVTSVNQGDFIETDIAQLIQDACDEIDDMILSKKAVITIGEIPAIKTIPALMRQVFINLISNSLKYSKEQESPIIKITASAGNIADSALIDSDKTFICISVNDNGIGFPETARLRLFDPFFRLHSKEEYEGTGIGLALCKKIMDLHSGYITCTGETGKGSEFNLYFPIFTLTTETN